MRLDDKQIHDLVMLWLSKSQKAVDAFASVEDLTNEYKRAFSKVKELNPNLNDRVKAGYSL